jgi:glycolate oxidase
LSTEHVSAIMKVAHRQAIPVTARGAGTNICGGSVPIHGGIVLAFTRMNRILEVSQEDRCAVVQPGVVNGHLQAEVEKLGLFYPPDPASLSVCTIGGNVAENAGGPRGVKYGVTRDYLLGLTVVLADGRVIKAGGRTLKNVTGYDLTSLFCASEGTLGIVTEITVKLIPKPQAQRSIQAIFPNLDGASQAVTKIMSAGILPASLELMDSVVTNLIEDSAKIGLPRDAEGLLLIAVDGTEELLANQVDRIARFCREQGASEVRFSRTREEDDALWIARRSAFGVMARARPNCVVEDVTVPVSQVPTMVREILAVAKRYNLLIGVLAHAGDGNMHPLILTDRQDQDEWHRVEKAYKEIFHRTVELGGTLSGEHGIGMAKEPFLDLVMDEDTRQIMRDIKSVLDPKGILNPGKFV